jgi:hypothetical protein
MSKYHTRGSITGAVALVVAVSLTAMTLLITGGSPATSATGRGAGAGGTGYTRIAHDSQGHAASKIVGTTASGKRVTGSFTPTGVSKRHGHLRVRGMVNGVIHRGDGSTRTFSAMRTLRVRSIDGTRPGATPAAHAGAGAGAGSCRVLHLVLAPLNLNLLGLKVHLAQVLLNVVAQSGSGQLLGNLVCAVAHLLDTGGTLSQLLSKLTAILNQLLMGL